MLSASWSPPLPCGMGLAGGAGAVLAGGAGGVAATGCAGLVVFVDHATQDLSPLNRQVQWNATLAVLVDAATGQVRLAYPAWKQPREADLPSSTSAPAIADPGRRFIGHR